MDFDTQLQVLSSLHLAIPMLQYLTYSMSILTPAMTISQAITTLQANEKQILADANNRIPKVQQLLADRNEMNSIPQEFYDIRYGWLQVIIGAVHEYHPFIREFLAKHGGNIYGSEEKDEQGQPDSYLEVFFLLLSNIS
jgi:hypothetical protein